MRRFIITLLSIAAMALVSSCNKNLAPDGATEGFIKKTIHLSAAEVLANKASFGEKTDEGYPVFWSEGDIVMLSVNGAEAQSITVTPEGDGSTADFGTITLDLPAEGSVEIFISTNTTGNGRNGTIKYNPTASVSQMPTGTSCDPSCMILYAKKTFESAEAVPDDIRVSFAHSTAYGKMTLSGISLDGGEKIKYVEIQTPLGQNIGGSVTLGEDGALSAGSHTSITLRDIEDLTNPVWFAIAPTVLNSDTALYVHVVTEADRHFEKILNCSSNPLEFKAGRVSKFTVNFSGISSAPRQVKTPRDLVLLKNFLNNEDYAHWVDVGVIKMANDLDYSGTAVSGNNTTLPEGITFDGQNHAIKNANISATIFKTVSGTVKNLKIEKCSNTENLFNTVGGTVENITITGLEAKSPLTNSISGTLDGLTIDDTSTFECIWPESTSGYNTGFVTRTNSGLIKNCTTAATINAGDPQRKSFNFGVFCPRVTTGQFENCINTGDVTLVTKTAVMTGCGLGGIVGTIASTQSNEVKILNGCRNEGNVTLTLNTPDSDYHRVCCVGGVVGGSYSDGTSSNKWTDESFPSSGVIYNCHNAGNITLNYNSPGTLKKSDTAGARGATVGGVVGATINDIDSCTNSGNVTGNFNIENSTNKAKAPKIGGVVGAAHNKVTNCTNEADAVVSIIGNLRNTYSELYAGAGPIQHPCIGGVAGCVGCSTAEYSNNAGSQINNCTNKSASIIEGSSNTYSATTLQKASVCGWTVASNSNNADLGGTELPVINPE